MTDLRETLIKRWEPHYERTIAEYEADGLLKFLTAAGYAIVPVEPTEAMGVAAVEAFDGFHYTQVWQAMIAAAQKEGQ